MCERAWFSAWEPGATPEDGARVGSSRWLPHFVRFGIEMGESPQFRHDPFSSFARVTVPVLWAGFLLLPAMCSCNFCAGASSCLKRRGESLLMQHRFQAVSVYHSVLVHASLFGILFGNGGSSCKSRRLHCKKHCCSALCGPDPALWWTLTPWPLTASAQITTLTPTRVGRAVGQWDGQWPQWDRALLIKRGGGGGAARACLFQERYCQQSNFPTSGDPSRPSGSR